MPKLNQEQKREQKQNRQNAVTRCGVKILLTTMKDLLVLINDAVAQNISPRATQRLVANYEAIEHMADRDLALVGETDPEFNNLVPMIIGAGSERLLRYVSNIDTNSHDIPYSVLGNLVKSCSVAFFKVIVAKGFPASRIMVPLMEVSDARPEIRAYLIDELSDNHLALHDTGNVAWASIVDVITKGPDCAIELIQRQRAAFPDRINAGAAARWNNGRTFNTILHLLLGAPPAIFEPPTRYTPINIPVHEQFSGGHSMLRMIRHFGDLEENRHQLQSLYDKYIRTLTL